jgi:osmotically-inducible protein OsmY
MGNKKSGSNFPRGSREQTDRENRRRHEAAGRYNTPGYYHYNEALGNSGNQNDQRSQRFPEGENDTLNTQYDDLNTGKYENYNGGGYYGSNYGSVNELNRGRDYEQNAGYRDNYNRLTTGQWPEIERANQSRGNSERQQNENAQGIHKGKGPRSYQRSDARIREDVHDRLMEDPYVDATDIEVTVENGEVILSGVVDDRQTKRRAEEIIEDISGVKHLENRLRARLPGGRMVNIQNSNQHND